MRPVFSSRQRIRSVPLVLRTVVKSLTKTRPSATAGPAKPPLIGVRHSMARPDFGNVSMTPDSSQTPRRPLPRHSGQSSARSWKAESAARTRRSFRIVRVSPYCIEKEKPHRKVSQGPRDSHFDAVRPFVGSDPAAARLVFLSFHSWLESASYFFPSREVQTVNCNLRSAVSLKL